MQCAGRPITLFTPSSMTKFSVAGYSSCLLVAMCLSYGAFASDELAKKSQNPVGDLVSVPIEFQHYEGMGPSGDSSANMMLLKPVYPVRIGEFNVINRFIVPVLALDAGSGGNDFEGIQPPPNLDAERGLGNIQYQGFVSPANPGGVIWGAGPVVEMPTAQNDLGSELWSAGVAAVVLTMPGKWVVGALAQNIWSVTAKDGEPDINKFTFQYFLNYNLEGGWYLTSTPVNSANWEADKSDRWTVPVGGGVGRLVRFGRLPVDFKLQAYGYAAKPDNGPDWNIQFTTKFLFPK